MSWFDTSWPVSLRYDTLTVRPLRPRDEAAYEEQREANHAWLTPWDATSPHPDAAGMGFRQMVRGINRAARAGESFTWGVALDTDHGGRDRLIGLVSLGGIQRGSILSGAVGYWIDERHAGRGLTPLAVAMVADWAFFSHGLHRVEVNVRPENAPSLRVPVKLGFRDEGLRERYLHVAGAWCDHRSFALTVEEAGEGVLARLLDGGARTPPEPPGDAPRT